MYRIKAHLDSGLALIFTEFHFVLKEENREHVADMPTLPILGRNFSPALQNTKFDIDLENGRRTYRTTGKETKKIHGKI